MSARCAAFVASVVRQRRAVHLHQLGARPMLELLGELAAEHGLAGAIDEKLTRFGSLDRQVVALLRADRFAPPPLYVATRTAT